MTESTLDSAVYRTPAPSLEPFTYNRLEDKEIRLFKITRAYPTVEGLLKVYRLANVRGRYDTLSYVCGTQERTVPIICNGKRLLVTQNLYDTMCQIFKHQRSANQSRPVWIDALCINQYDPDDMAKQIPKMAYIYPSAKRTLVYLGPAADNSDLALQIIANLSFQQQLSQMVQFEFTSLSAQGFGMEHPVWLAFSLLLLRPWSGRVWTLQEAALSKDLYIGCGTQWIQWHVLSNFLSLIYLKGLNTWLNSAARSHYEKLAVQMGDSYDQSFLNTLQVESTREEFRANGSIPMAHIFEYASQRDCFEPVDRLWGLLGLMPKSIQAQVKNLGLADQTVRGRREYWTTYIKFAKIFIEQDPRLTIFSWVVFNDRDDPNHVPSWCPDWTTSYNYGRGLEQVRRYRAGYSDQKWIVAHVSVDDSNHKLSVFGIRADKVVKVLPNHLPDIASKDYDAESIVVNTRNFEDECLLLSRETYRDSDEVLDAHWRTIIGDLVVYTDIDGKACTRASRDEDVNAYHQWRDFLHDTDDSFEGSDDEFQDVHMFSQSFVAACKGRRFFSTVGGRIGLGPPSMKVGDDICVFYGAGPVFVLRFEPNGKEAKLVGDAYLHGLMRGETLRDARDLASISEDFILI